MSDGRLSNGFKWSLKLLVFAITVEETVAALNTAALDGTDLSRSLNGHENEHREQ